MEMTKISLGKLLELIPNGQEILIMKGGKSLKMFLKRKLKGERRTTNKTLIGTTDEDFLFHYGIKLVDIVRKYESDSVFEIHYIILED